MRMSNKTDRIQRAHHAKEDEKLNAVASLRNGVSTRAVAKKHKVTTQTIYKWDKSYSQELIKERSIDGEIRYLIKQAYAAQCNRIPF